MIIFLSRLLPIKEFTTVIHLEHPDRKELRKIFKMTMLIHKDKNIARILAATMRRPLSPQQISKICDIPPMQCYRTIKKLKQNGLIKVVRKVAVKGKPDKSIFFYKAQLNPEFFYIENGRFKVRFPAVFRLSNGKEVDLKAMFESRPVVNNSLT